MSVERVRLYMSGVKRAVHSVNQINLCLVIFKKAILKWKLKSKGIIIFSLLVLKADMLRIALFFIILLLLVFY